MNEHEWNYLKGYIKWSPVIIITQPIMITIVLIIYGIPNVLYYIYRRVRWLFNKQSWYEYNNKEDEKR